MRHTAAEFALLVVVLLSASAQAQDTSVEYFPHDVGDRWVYAVEGTTARGDTLDAEIEWTVVDVRAATTVDTVRVYAVRRDPSGAVSEATCEIERSRDSYRFLRGLSASALCRSGGGFPFGDGLTTSYPYLSDLTAIGFAAVPVGMETVMAEMATARNLNSYTSGPWNPYKHSETRVSAQLADGIGLVSAEIIEKEYRGMIIGYTHRDTVRTTLLGAEVGGRTYGTIRPVSSNTTPGAVGLTVSVAPNPTAGEARIYVRGDTGEDVRLQLLDARGRIVHGDEGRVGAEFVLDLSGLAPGLYFARVSSGASVTTAHVTVGR